MRAGFLRKHCRGTDAPAEDGRGVRGHWPGAQDLGGAGPAWVGLQHVSIWPHSARPPPNPRQGFRALGVLRARCIFVRCAAYKKARLPCGASSMAAGLSFVLTLPKPTARYAGLKTTCTNQGEAGLCRGCKTPCLPGGSSLCAQGPPGASLWKAGRCAARISTRVDAGQRHSFGKLSGGPG